MSTPLEAMLGNYRAADSLWIGKPFDARNNSLNLIRLVFAVAVLVHHAWPLSGTENSPSFAGDTLGGWAVAGFFVISGYLITHSRFTHSLGDYLVHRIARIVPAFIVCLIVVAAVFAPIGYAKANGTLDGFFGTGTTPFNYVFTNLGLRMNAYDVAGTPAAVPYAGVWNGSLWSIYFEFCCYIIVAFIGLFALVRKSPWPITVLFVLSVAANVAMTRIAPYAQGNYDFTMLMHLLPFFLGGSVVYVWKHRIGIHWLPAVLSLAAAAVLTAFFPTWGGGASGAFIAYGLLWISLWLPSPQLVKKNDVSYGIYIYAFPVQQLLALYGLHERGLPAYIIIAGVLTFLPAICSWIWLERPIMRTVRRAGKAAAPHAAVPQPSAGPAAPLMPAATADGFPEKPAAAAAQA
ncbi:acyltransferase [Arthrobacter sp. 08Y14]|uniref:acyltransferase family protein n=1 Tax=Arthrobacter sp. 08Y14 TaxID=2058885 RepID=UPI0011B056D4|nr:acyltransferase [Arthrobacter sp. 08Y14]